MKNTPSWYGSLIQMRVHPGVTPEQLGETVQHWHAQFGARYADSTLDLLMQVAGTADQWIILHLFRTPSSYEAVKRDPEVRQWTQALVALFGAPPIITEVGVVWGKPSP